MKYQGNLMFPFMPSSFWLTRTTHFQTKKHFWVCTLSFSRRLFTWSLVCLAMFRVHLIVVIMLGKTPMLDWAWAIITWVCILNENVSSQTSECHFLSNKKNWNDATVCCRTPVHSSSVLPLARWRSQLGWISPSTDRSDLRLVIKPPTCGAHKSLWRRLIPDPSQEGSECS